MELIYLGTAAAEGIPAIFCDCPVCRHARLVGGRDIRTRSQAIIDGKLLIDFGADTYMHALRENINLSRIKSVLITHSHNDHLYPKDLTMRNYHFAYPPEGYETLTLYGSPAVGEAIREAEKEDNRVRFVEAKPFETFEVEGYRVTAYPARHDEKAGPLFYVIEDENGHSLLYGHDTGYYFDEVWEALAKREKPITFASLDCTEAAKIINYDSHGCLERDCTIKDRMLAEGIADENTVFCLNHFSHNGLNVEYDRFLPLAMEKGFIISHDGMHVTI